MLGGAFPHPQFQVLNKASTQKSPRVPMDGAPSRRRVSPCPALSPELWLKLARGADVLRLLGSGFPLPTRHPLPESDADHAGLAVQTRRSGRRRALGGSCDRSPARDSAAPGGVLCPSLYVASPTVACCHDIWGFDFAKCQKELK